MDPFIFRGWVIAGDSKQITSKPTAYEIAGLRVVIYRDSEGQAHAFQGTCPHMNADLAQAAVVKDQLVCAFHAWRFDSQGQCVSMPGNARCLKQKAGLKKFALLEKFSLVFVFPYGEPKFEPEFFPERDSSNYDRSIVRTLDVDTDWHLAAANSFDLSHFLYVHKRRLLKDPEVANPIPSTYKIDLLYEILGDGGWMDRLICLFNGRHARLIFHVCGGNYIRAEVQFGRATNLMIMTSEPLGPGKSRTKIVVFARKRLFSRFKVKVQSFLSYQFFKKEVNLLKGVRINWDRLTTSDATLIDYYSWLKSAQDVHFNSSPRERVHMHEL